jgi:hypothetical protein
MSKSLTVMVITDHNSLPVVCLTIFVNHILSFQDDRKKLTTGVTITLALGGYQHLCFPCPLISHNGDTKLNNSHGCQHLLRTYAEFGPTLVSCSPMSCLCLLTSTGALILIDIIAKAIVADLITCILVLSSTSVPLPTDATCHAYIVTILAYAFRMFMHYNIRTLGR